jgi:pimeloyl-ACP methyl ester carboxylesterase
MATPGERPALVLVHGGSHAGDCWGPTVAALADRAPDLRVLAVDLPGRGQEPGDLATLTIERCADSVVEQVDRAGLDRVVLVGHSMAGITLPGAARRLGAERLAGLVWIACAIPPEGGTVLDTISGPLRFVAARRARSGGVSAPMPRPLARWAFCNGMTPEQTAWTLARQHREAATVLAEPVSQEGMPVVPRTWVIPLRDRAQPPARQREAIERLGIADVVELDACHDVMVSHPDELAGVLAERAR